MRLLLKIALAGITLCAIAATAGMVAFWWYIVRDLPQINSLRDYKPKLITHILARDGTEIGSLAEERRIVVPIESIPDHVVQAFVASEDKRFYEHEGLDYGGILRAFWSNLKAGHTVAGGSTITQQVAKTFLLTSERSYIRKAKDMVLARRIERTLDKNDILFLYMNQIYLGSGAYGIEAAAQTYFGKPASQLSIAEAAVIVGVVPAPSTYSPRRSPKRARARQELVLRRMREEGFITPDQYKTALAEKLTYPPQRITAAEEASKYFVEEVRRWLIDRYGEKRVLTDGLTVQTTLDVTQQIAGWKAVRAGLRAHDRRAGYRGPTRNVPEGERPTLLKELAEKQPDVPKPGEATRRQALVTAVDDKKQEARLATGPERQIVWKLDDVKWARKPDPEVDGGTEKAEITRIGDALHPGDLIEVEFTGRDEKGNPSYRLYEEPVAEGALLAMEVETGNVTAMIGGYDYDRSQFNRATQAKRQPGSSFKPFIYTEALRRGYTPATIVYDTPMVFEDDIGTWKPKNYTYSFSGPITLRDALANSKNIATIKVLQDIGVPSVIERARAMGISSELEPNLALALGSSSVTLAELVRAYATFPAGGRLLDPTYIAEVRDREGQVLDHKISLLAERPAPYGEDGSEGGQVFKGPFSAVAQGPEKAAVDRPVIGRPGADPQPLPPGYAIDPQTAFLMVDMMRAVVEEGTGQRVKTLRRTIAGKTGTTNELYDAWFIGYSPTIVAGAWIGYDNIASLGASETGSRAASPIFIDFMRTALEAEPKGASFAVPQGIEFYRIDKKTGLLARGGTDGIFQPFREGTQPTEYETNTAGSPGSTTRAPRLD